MELKNKRQRLKSCSWKSLVLLSVLLASCATPVPNVPLCVEVNLMRARCVKIISGEQFAIDDEHPFENKTWWEIRPAVIQVPASSWAEIKKFIIKICKKTNQCQQEVASWDRSVQAIDDNLSNKEGIDGPQK